MDCLLNEHPGHENDEPSLSEEELANLIETKFVLQKTESKQRETDGEVEQARTVISPMALQLDPIGRRDDGVILEEHECLRRPLVEKAFSDGATILTNRILKASEVDLKNFRLWDMFERSKRWKQTSRASELALINSVISSGDARPVHLHVFLRRLIETDVFELVRKSLLEIPPPTKYRSSVRMTIKVEPEMPLQQLLCQLDVLYNSIPNLEVTEGKVTALRVEVDGFKQKLFTEEVFRFSQLEKNLMSGEPAEWIGTTVRLGFAVHERSHVAVSVTYRSELEGSTGKRTKNITVEQSATPLPHTVPTRHVTFGTPELTAIHRYELPENVPFNPLGMSHKFRDLIQHLERMGRVTNESIGDPAYRNVTIR